MADQYYEYIVIGLGGVGSGALYWLSKTVGAGVLGIEQFSLGHGNGGSQDYSRIIRHVYHDERYTKLTRAMFDAWKSVENESGLQLVYHTGGVSFCPRDSKRVDLLNDIAKALTKSDIKFERMDGEELHRRYPQFKTDKNIEALYQENTGIVDAAMGNAAHVQMAQSYGATVIDRCPVIRLEPTTEGGCTVHTVKGTFRCRRVVVTAGAWINHVLGTLDVQIPVKVTQEQVTYFATPHIKKFTKDNFPVFSYVDDEHNFYGMPIHGNTGTKIGIDAGGPVVQPETRTYQPCPIRENACRKFFEKYIPEASGLTLYTKTCLYTMTHDRHFVVDSLTTKGLPQVIVCCGAGHIYKFASLMGKILSQLAVGGQTEYDISGFNFDREAVTNMNYKPTFKITYDPTKSRL